MLDVDSLVVEKIGFIFVFIEKMNIDIYVILVNVYLLFIKKMRILFG